MQNQNHQDDLFNASSEQNSQSEQPKLVRKDGISDAGLAHFQKPILTSRSAKKIFSTMSMVYCTAKTTVNAMLTT
jgi:hypothetical protein